MVTIEIIDEVSRFFETWQDNPSRFSGWLHHYFCDKDANELIFNPNEADACECPECGQIYQDSLKKDAWVSLYRERTFDFTCEAALLFDKTGEARYFDIVRSVLTWYGKNYDLFIPHVKERVVNMEPYNKARSERSDEIKMIDSYTLSNGLEVVGPGKVLAQGLDEAIAMIRLAISYDYVKEFLSSAERKSIKGLFQKSVSFLESQQFVIHNITLWREVAIQILHLILNDGEFSLTRPLGIHDHLKYGVTRDGLWYEGSLHYHFYTIEALSYLAFMMKRGQFKDDVLKNYIYDMLKFPIDVSFKDGHLPNPNDGWSDLSLKTYLGTYGLCNYTYSEDFRFQKLYLMVCESRSNQKESVGNINYSITNRIVNYLEDSESVDYTFRWDPSNHSRNFPETRMVTLRSKSGFEVFAKYGVITDSHAHHDPLNFEIYYGANPISKDISNSGYGNKLTDSWYRTAYCHNAVIKNQRRHCNLNYNASVHNNKNYLRMESFDSYEDLLVKKEIQMLKNGVEIITDCYNINASDSELLQVQHFDINSEINFDERLLVDIDIAEAKKLGFPEAALRSVKQLLPNKQILKGYFSIDNDDFNYQLEVIGKGTIFVIKTVGNPAHYDRQTITVNGNGSLKTKQTIQHLQ